MTGIKILLTYIEIYTLYILNNKFIVCIFFLVFHPRYLSRNIFCCCYLVLHPSSLSKKKKKTPHNKQIFLPKLHEQIFFRMFPTSKIYLPANELTMHHS